MCGKVVLAIKCGLAITLVMIVQPVTAAVPLVEPYLLEGKLSEGAAALEARLREAPEDDEARFGLGVLQFLQTFEQLGARLYQYGLRTGERSFLRPPAQVRALLPQNPNPEALTYAVARQSVQDFVDHLLKAEATLAKVTDSAVKLPLHVGLIKIDPFGQGQPINATFLLGRLETVPPQAAEQARALVIGFDRGDVSWLRGYCHFLAAWGEMILAMDGERMFDCSAHLFFEKVVTPHAFLLEDRRGWNDLSPLANTRMFSDILSFLHQMMRLEVKEPARTQAVISHLESGIGQAKEMWTFILDEQDDDQEWIPNPRQTGVVGVEVTQDIVNVWRETLDEAEAILKGAKLIPFWRGNPTEFGLNLRRAITESRELDIIEWVQGTAATPYLEKGEFTKLADPVMGRRLNDAFGGPFNWIGFGFWFN